jgi:hypothetical protein
MKKTNNTVLQEVRKVFEQKLNGDPNQIVQVTFENVNYVIHHESMGAVKIEKRDIDDKSNRIIHALRSFLQ